MFRIVTAAAALMVLCSAPCFAQGGKAKPAKSISHGVGDRFTTTAPIKVAVDEYDAMEFARSAEAGDVEGIAAMLEAKKAIELPANLELVVLEISTVDRLREDKSSVCRVIQDGKAIGKYAIHYSYFTTAHMKPKK